MRANRAAHLANGVSSEGTKTCSCCSRELPKLCFTLCRSNKDGLRAWCADCHNADHRKLARRYKEQNAGRLPNELAPKWCNACKQVLLMKDFPASVSKKQGVSTFCRDCKAAKRR